MAYTVSIEECSENCDFIIDCNAFAYNKKNGKCKLVNKFAPRSRIKMGQFEINPKHSRNYEVCTRASPGIFF